VAVDRADAHARALGDRAHRRIDARFRKHIHGCLQQRTQVALGVDALGARLLGIRRVAVLPGLASYS
jgi:hypothetical protein